MLRLETQQDTFISANGRYAEAEAEADTRGLGGKNRPNLAFIRPNLDFLGQK